MCLSVGMTEGFLEMECLSLSVGMAEGFLEMDCLSLCGNG